MSDRSGEWERTAVKPFEVFPELYRHMDIQLLSAIATGDDASHAAAVGAASREVVERIAHLRQPWVLNIDADATIESIDRHAAKLFERDAPVVGKWVRGILDHWRRQQSWFNLTVDIIAAADDDDLNRAVLAAAECIRRATFAFLDIDFGRIPCVPDDPFYGVLLAVGEVFTTHRDQEPLRVQLDCVGGLAATPEHNPWVAALIDQELVIYRRLYRAFFRLLEQAGMFDDREGDRDFFHTPDQVDRQAL
ncbi:hypothetical protein MAUB_38420 [Mycolicibacterium aubagnense]|uniref:Uncharacterized protein n=1 Tax=Mycolicibacterium aubagnense TaxID=319707 RepID=A0ABM7IGZ1_9MYCO|nr:hypothetical protein C1S80_02215 [Mycolicibacterium aubagnense]BBX85969.1 hypothetical protein MAUB_38420 [Mycolicibacterium aubagnense]